jgi:hypothetical protein
MNIVLCDVVFFTELLKIKSKAKSYSKSVNLIIYVPQLFKNPEGLLSGLIFATLRSSSGLFQA